MSSLLAEAAWAVSASNDNNLIDEDDSSLLFVSWDSLDGYLTHLQSAFDHSEARHTIAIKTQPHLSVLKHIAERGFGLEAASIEEVKLAVSAKAPYIVFDSPVKRPSEISFCQSLSIPLLLNVNVLEELDRLPAKPNFDIGIRINPQVSTDSPEIFKVSGDDSKFGVPLSERQQILDAIVRYPITALHVHSGSSMNDMQGQIDGISEVVALAQEANRLLENTGSPRRIDCLDIGGGMAPEVLRDSQSAMQRYTATLKSSLPPLWHDFKIVTEFGQWVHFYTGYAVTDIEYAIERAGKRIAFLHLGADFFMRDAYTQPRSFHFSMLGENYQVKQGETVSYDLAGPLCFAGDYVSRDVELPSTIAGDKLLILNTGSNAYGLWSRHCSRTIPKMIGVSYKDVSLAVLSDRTNPFI